MCTPPLDSFVSLLIFRVDTQRFALELEVVERVVRAVAITPLPDAPSTVLGIINLTGNVVPVLSPRRKLGFTERELSPDDQFVIARVSGRTVACLVDEVETVVRLPASEVGRAVQITPSLGRIPGTVRLADGIVLIHELETFFSAAEARALDDALAEEATHG
jgi:purine-binding chemotaxis protein CheW